MASRALFATFVLSAALPVLAQQPVYPNYPPPPPASGDNAPHTQSPDQTDQAYPDQAQPDQQGYPTNQTPQKPSPYPPDDTQSGAQTGQTQPSYPQQNTPAQQPYPQQSAPAYPPPDGYLSWIPQGMGALARTAAFHTDFTFDRAMLQLASGIWEGPSDPALADDILDLWVTRVLTPQSRESGLSAP